MTDNEFSTPKITPVDSVKIPSVSTETSGYMLASEFKSYATLEVNERIDALAGGIIPKGEIASADLPEASSENQGWMYWLTDLGKYVVSDGTEWVDFGSYPIESYATFDDLPVEGSPNRLYITTTDKVLYWWDGSEYVPSYANLLDGTDTVAKATADASGNTITTTYETKADHALDISIINKKIDNLEQTSGQTEIEVSYPDDVLYSPNIVPAKSAKWASVDKLRGVTRGWNQLVTNGDFSDGFTDWSAQGNTNTPTVSDGVCTFLATAQGGGVYHPNINVISGHKYLIVFMVKVTTANTVLNFTTNLPTSENNIVTIPTTNWTIVCLIKQADGTSSSGIIQCRDHRTESFDNIQVDFGMIRDLSLIFPSDTPTTVAGALQRSADLAKWDDYGYSMVTETVSGVKTIGFNRLDLDSYMEDLEISKSGDYYSTLCVTFDNKTGTTPFPIDWIYGQRYSFRMTGHVSATATPYIRIEYTDGTADGTSPINQTTDTTVTVASASDKTIKRAYISYGGGGNNTFYLKSVTVSVGTDTTKDAEYEEHTLTLPTPFSGKSAGSVAEVYDLSTGKVSHPIGDVTITNDNTEDAGSNANRQLFAVVLDYDLKFRGNSEVPNIMLAGFVPVTPASTFMPGIISEQSGQLRRIYVAVAVGTSKSDFITAHGGKKIYYELATPDPDTTVTPMDDPTIQVQGNGTIETVQTQSPVLDNCLDVTYDIIP